METETETEGNRNGMDSLLHYALLNAVNGPEAHEVTEGVSGQSFNSGHGIHAPRIPSVSKLSNAVQLLAKTARSQRVKTGAMSGNPLLSGNPLRYLTGDWIS